MKNVYVGQKDIFYNSECLFVEYNDVLSIPWFFLLLQLRNDETMNEVFDMELLKNYSTEEMVEWYLFRKHRNILKNIPLKNPNFFNETSIDYVLNELMDITPSFYSDFFNLNFVGTLQNAILHKNIIHKFIIYSEYTNEFIVDAINRNYPSVSFVSGDFTEAVKNVPNNSTFVFSDINKINILAKMNKLKYSSILVVDGYRYNYMEDDKNKIKIDIEGLMKEHIFKLDFFNNFNIIEE